MNITIAIVFTVLISCVVILGIVGMWQGFKKPIEPLAKEPQTLFDTGIEKKFESDYTDNERSVLKSKLDTLILDCIVDFHSKTSIRTESGTITPVRSCDLWKTTERAVNEVKVDIKFVDLEDEKIPLPS